MIAPFRGWLAATAFSALAIASAQAQAPNKNAKLTVGWAEPIDTLNPATTGARNQGPLLINIFDTLVWLTPDFKVEPLLAKSWTIAPDGKTYSFTLREDVKFHDGTAFDAEAVVANIKYITDKETPAKVSIALLGPCKEAVATGKYTVDIKCATPYAPLLTQLGVPYLGIQSPKAIAEYGKDLGLHPTGTGPFAFVSYEPNQSLVVKRNEAYAWNPASVGHKGPPDIAEVKFQIVPNAQARVSQFQSGQSQMMQQTPGVHWNAMQKMGRFTAIPVPITGLGICAPVNAKKFPTNDIAVRRAIQYAVDKKGVVQLAEAGAIPPSLTPLQPSMTAYDKSLETMYPFDPAKAEQTLKDGGWTKKDGFWEKDGKRLTLTITAISTSTSYPLLAQAMQNYLQKIGMEVNVQQLASPAWLAANINGDMSLTPLQYIGVDADALSNWFTAGQYFNWSHYSNPKLDELFKQGREQTDPSKRLPIYAEIQKILMDEAVILPIRQNIDLVMTSKKLTGVTYSGGGFEYLGAATLAD
ncbi:MAG: ABC transporter substrate-binding protein [Bosea sp. (in: a-proteobacteria)]|nr:ABC transporter substrate-binding protein [Bosea sp. (in: a-proteobacteria)]